MKKAIAVLSVLVIISLIGFAFFSRGNSHEDDLAAALKVELNAVKEWQSRGGLKKQLKSGSSGAEVRLLQAALRSDPAIKSKPSLTGYFGNDTLKAVIAFQKKNDLPATGLVGEQTREKLNELYFNEACPTDSSVHFPDLSLAQVDKTHALPADYTPNDLVNITGKVKTQGIACLKKIAADNLIEMFEAAKQEGINLSVSSSFRRPEIQSALYTFWLTVDYAYNIDKVAPPNHSEHQLGTAVDLSGSSINNNGVEENFAYTQEGKWLAANAYRFGYILSYPENKKHITGYDYEPWHYRFVGDSIAREITQRRMTLTELFTERNNTDLGAWQLTLR